jgi:hypothetical protein
MELGSLVGSARAWAFAMGPLVAVVVHAGDLQAAGEHQLQVAGDTANTSLTASNPTCVGDGAGNTYYAEAWGYDMFGNIACEASTPAHDQTTAFVYCNTMFNDGITQQAVITLRNSTTLAYVSTLAQTAKLSWTTISPLLETTVPSSTGCPGGGVIAAKSVGQDTTQ